MNLHISFNFSLIPLNNYQKKYFYLKLFFNILAKIACQRCCRSITTGICSPVKPEHWLQDNSMCIYGHCINVFF